MADIVNIVHCPICDKEVEQLSWYGVDGHVLSEEEACCPTNHWSYGFSYGAYRESVGAQDWYWSYTTDFIDVARIDEEINAAIIQARKELLHG